MNRWVVGVDFGQRADRTAIAALEVVPVDATDEVLFPKPRLVCRWLERLPVGMDYPMQCARLTALIEDTAELERAELIVDATGVGIAVADTLREQMRRGFTELSITAGQKVKADGRRLSVPKRDLVSRLAVVMQQRRLHVAPGLVEGPALFDELGSFGVIIGDAGRESYGARTGHDDLVLALSYAVWQADRPGGTGDAFLQYMKRETALNGVAAPRSTWRRQRDIRQAGPPRPPIRRQIGPPMRPLP